MTGWLVARQQAVSRLVLWLDHERGRARREPTALEIVLAEPSWQEDHLTRLLKERLSRLTLTAPVIALRLEATQRAAWAPPNTELFTEPGGTPEDYHRLLELLAARLGPAARASLARLRLRLATAGRTLAGVSPLATLDRGYAIVTRLADGRVLVDAAAAEVGDAVEARLARGRLRATITSKAD
jgi:exonuclease VII large subunit